MIARPNDTDLLGWLLVILFAVIIYCMYVIIQIAIAGALLTLLAAFAEVLA